MALSQPHRVHGLPQPRREFRPRPSPLQCNRDHDYGGVKVNQLQFLEHLGVLRANWQATHAPGAQNFAKIKVRRKSKWRWPGGSPGSTNAERHVIAAASSRKTTTVSPIPTQNPERRAAVRTCMRTVRFATSKRAAATLRWNLVSRPR